MEHNNHYKKEYKPLARSLRTNSTKAEVRLWCELLSKGKTGYSFLRQRSIGNYIADFMCKELKLVIEVDGYSHNFKTAEDQQRDKDLSDLGFTTIRFSDEEVMKDLPNMERVIQAYIDRFLENHCAR
ncbi:endonuclease domain-containing protein [Pontibacter liquoris]|uniref:endonuclease domain-containing protein n=1 Tax=Pontibacter liquoris TaxID=2905677 RepID=UPI001FA70138|nr:endonuclease domain-containing protein [Pontibacter liquoris]